NTLLFCIFFFYCYAVLRHLHSFPTRRSSDLSTYACSSFGKSPTHHTATGMSGMSNALTSGGMCGTRSPPATIATSSQQTCFSARSEEHTSELQSRGHLVCRLLLEKKKQKQ